MSRGRLPGTVHVHEDAGTLADAAATWLLDLAVRTLEERGGFDLGLTGGSTPRTLYERVAASPRCAGVDWRPVRFWFSDERAVPPTDPRSNYRMAHDALLAHLPILLEQVNRMPAEEIGLDAAARRYSDLLQDALPASPSQVPRLDCLLLGLGTNGHVASLFPGTPALQVHDRWAARGLADYEPYDRMTLTFPTINAAAAIAFIVTGAEKREALRGVCEERVPAARVVPEDGELHWFLDRAAAEGLALAP